ncbi:Calcium/calmodulin-dependent protein kinase type I [Rhizina undulata]
MDSATNGGMASATTGTNSTPRIFPCRYKIGQVLGQGSYSIVKECIHIDTGRYYAAKVIKKSLIKNREDMVRSEIEALKKISLGHQNLLTLADYFETFDSIYLVMELAVGGELFHRICHKGSYPEDDVAQIIRSTMSAVAFLHDNGIVHRDLKPENLLFRTSDENANIVIVDFGLSAFIGDDPHALDMRCGTEGYMAPEILMNRGYGKPVDIWAIGVITYFLLCGNCPFDRKPTIEAKLAILEANYKFEPVSYWANVSETARGFIRRCLVVDPKKRLTAHQALDHYFLREHVPGESGNTLPVIMKNFDAKRTLHAAIDTIRAINKMKEAGTMDGALSIRPEEFHQKQSVSPAQPGLWRKPTGGLMKP